MGVGVHPLVEDSLKSFEGIKGLKEKLLDDSEKRWWNRAAARYIKALMRANRKQLKAGLRRVARERHIYK